MASITPYVKVSNKLCIEEVNRGNLDFIMHVLLTEEGINESKIPSIGLPSLNHDYSRFSINPVDFPNMKYMYNMYHIEGDTVRYTLSVVLPTDISFHNLEKLLNNTEEIKAVQGFKLHSTSAMMSATKDVQLPTNIIKLKNGGLLNYSKNTFTFADNQIPIDPRFIEIVEGYIQEQ